MYFQSSSTSQNALLWKPSIVKWRRFENVSEIWMKAYYFDG